ncbi:unnamed protein product [Sphenostylis stenocarpa]|uniref:Glycoside hydrolase family 5 domain-containing protein n=1 Tax=Sphenostylis stenocarpa TaxID=92480 RepID=A0AA86VAH7_9FABA|nr:unnamed protein product [Sphenostylis stenocarpa]
MIPEGLDKRPLKDIIGEIVEHKFNCVRLTYAIYMWTRYVHDNVNATFTSLDVPGVVQGISKNNPFVLSMTHVQVFDSVVRELGIQNVKVLLDNHVSEPKWCCNDDDENGFFHDRHFNPQEWVYGLTRAAKHFNGNHVIVAMSLRNELHGPRQNLYDWYSKPLKIDLGKKMVFETHLYSWSGIGTLKLREIWTKQPVNRICADNIKGIEDRAGFLTTRQECGSFDFYEFGFNERWIIDEGTGQRAKLACANWAGHLQPMIPEGLDKRPLKDIIGEIVEHKFNCVRLTYAIYMWTRYVHDNVNATFTSLDVPGVVQGISKNNPFVLSMTHVQVFDSVVRELGIQNVKVLLDNHVSEPKWCCNDDDENGFFHDRHFNPQEWVYGLTLAAKHFNGNHVIVAMSLRNELHGPRQNLYDWYRYMSKAAVSIHKTNPNVLVVISGLNYDTELQFLKCKPLKIDLGKKMVFETHLYSWSGIGTLKLREIWTKQPVNRICADNIKGIEDRAGFLTTGKNAVPLIFTEFGFNEVGSSVEDNRFLTCLQTYLVGKDLDWGLWAFQDEGTGQRAKLACANWAGHLQPMIPEGLDKRPLKDIIGEIVEHKFNCVRLTYAIYMWTRYVHDNVFDSVVRELGIQNVKVLLDNHVSEPKWCCNDDDENGFFHDRHFNPQEWVYGLTLAAKHFNGNHVIVAMSLRNELHGPCQNLYDWYRYMSKAAVSIHKTNLNVLVVIFGLNYDTELQFLKSKPLKIDLGKKMVFETHLYSWSGIGTLKLREIWTKQPVNRICADNIKGIEDRVGFLTTGKNAVPLIFTEFGFNEVGSSVEDNRWIIDEGTGQRAQLACANWAGHLQPMIPEGLDKRPLKDIIDEIVEHKFNCVRLTYAIYMWTRYVHDNVFDSVVHELGIQNVKVLLDNHVSEPKWCCNDDDENGFFHDRHFNPQEWVYGLTLVAKHFNGNHVIVAMSLRNELHGPRQNLYDSFLKSKPLKIDLGKKMVFETHLYSWSGIGTTEIERDMDKATE